MKAYFFVIPVIFPDISLLPLCYFPVIFHIFLGGISSLCKGIGLNKFKTGILKSLYLPIIYYLRSPFQYAGEAGQEKLSPCLKAGRQKSLARDLIMALSENNKIYNLKF